MKTESGGMSIENVGDGDAFVSWRTQELPSSESVTNEASGISITREFLKSDWLPADMDNLARGELLTVYYQQPPTGGKPCIMATKWRLNREWK
jgi:hypothetical protein